ncbi:beta-ketoacyl-[acyl-carrier-protein] synthase family protein [Amycolatopsis nigrescens]|uniref:beta-ketoacyl-[acyl-carrier-protein] synthase family protein n=1 Tax=Amycolatopsis nigrescens TaxID=381445 RepID=UPI0003701B23|nr:beta-ketoacyl-[acyl-carrier-protein] synthase family protein [Amycolatopsis nigrescens]
MSERPGVWITGVGVVSPGGWTAEDTWQRVVDGKPCGRPVERFPLYEAPAKFGAPVPGYEHEAPVDESLAIRFGQSALAEALADAGLTPHTDRIDAALVSTHGERTLPRPGHGSLLAHVQDVVDAVRDASGATRASSVYGACASGALVVGSAVKLIESGQADVVVAGGADSMLREVDFFSFCSLYAMTVRDCAPTEACAPFDARRDGFLMAEGAGFVVLESERHARARGADPLARIEGFGSAQNAYHSVASPPDALGPSYAMSRALADAKLDPSQIDYINAHGTATRDNDWCETLAIRKALGQAAEEVPISSSKGVLGHTMAPAGTIETILCVKALRDGIAPPTANLEEPDPACDLDYIPKAARELELNHIITNSFGFGGHNASLILGKA